MKNKVSDNNTRTVEEVPAAYFIQLYPLFTSTNT